MTDETTSTAGEQDESVAAWGMLVAAYVDEYAASQAYDEMKAAKKRGEFYFDHAAVIRQDAKGKVHIKETGDMSTGKGLGVGALIGGVVGLLAGPVGWAAVGGALVGGVAAHHDAGFSNKSLKEIGSALVPGSSAVIATTSKKFVEAIRKEEGSEVTLSMAQDLAEGIRSRLLARQDVLYGLILTEEGMAATEVVSSPSEVAVFGIAATEEGVIVGQAVATAEGAAYEIAATDGEVVAYEAGVVTDEGAAVVDVIAMPADEAEADDDDEASSEDTA